MTNTVISHFEYNDVLFYNHINSDVRPLFHTRILTLIIPNQLSKQVLIKHSTQTYDLFSATNNHCIIIPVFKVHKGFIECGLL